MVLWLAVLAEAKPPETVHPGEFYGHWGGWTGTAYTTPKGTVALHPFIRSSFGVTDFLDIKASFLGELFGPHIAFEIAPVQNNLLALSLESRVGTGWGFRGLDYGVVPHFSVHASENVLFDASLGIHGYASAQDPGDTTNGVPARASGLDAIRPEISADFKVNDPLWFVLTMRGDALAWSRVGPQGALGGHVVYGKGGFGISAGGFFGIVGLEGINADFAQIEEDLGVDLINLPAAFPIPLPHLTMWARL